MFGNSTMRTPAAELEVKRGWVLRPLTSSKSIDCLCINLHLIVEAHIVLKVDITHYVEPVQILILSGSKLKNGLINKRMYPSVTRPIQ